MTRPLALTCAVSFLLPLTLAHAAAAKPKVALTQIEGDASGDVRDAVAEALEGKELSLIGSREVNRAVDKLGDVADLTEKDFKKLASELEADAIVAGKLDRVGTAKTLKFRLFVHKKMAKGFTVSFKDAKSEKFRAKLHEKMVDMIGAGGGEEEDARPAKKKKGAEDEEDPLAGKKDKKKSKLAKAEEEEARPAKKSRAEEEEERPAKKSKTAKAEPAEEEEARPAKASKSAKASAEDEETRPAKASKSKASEEAAPEAEEEAKPAKKAAEDDEEAPRKAKKKVAAAEDGEEIEGGLVATAEPRRGANLLPVRLDMGGSVVQHSFRFNTAAGVPNSPKNVRISPVGGARLAGEVYPLALSSSRGMLAGLGIGFLYDKTVSLNLSARNPNNEMTFKVPGKQSHFSVGLRYRLAFGSSETSPTLTVGVGYAKQLFSTDLSGVNDDVARAAVLRDTPETDYTIIDPGLMFRMPVTRMVAFAAGGRALIVTGAGPVQRAESYGRARVFGGEAIGMLDVVITSHFGLRFTGEFTQIAYNFSGGGRLANNLDGDPASKDVGGLADRSIGGSASVSVLY